MTFEAGIFSGKTAVVTGATSGIGAGVAAGLSKLGAEIWACGVGPVQADLPASVRLHALDVKDNEAVEGFIASVPAIDIVVNCAGIIRRGDEHRPDVFEQVLNVNLLGTMRLCAAARPKLKEKAGCIVNMASMLSFFGGGLVPAYAASKGGVAQLTKSLAIAYAADGIRVNAVAPGWIATPLTQALQDDPARAQPILDRTPLGRWGTPEDVAQVVAFLCSPAAQFITGVILPVDGGYLIA
jgi:NAD(P)-dependent dehydrogenase (short-subunit alcohol dehydrogenase family)